jgi:hypothetical protein
MYLRLSCRLFKLSIDLLRPSSCTGAVFAYQERRRLELWVGSGLCIACVVPHLAMHSLLSIVLAQALAFGTFEIFLGSVVGVKWTWQGQS